MSLLNILILYLGFVQLCSLGLFFLSKAFLTLKFSCLFFQKGEQNWQFNYAENEMLLEPVLCAFTKNISVVDVLKNIQCQL